MVVNRSGAVEDESDYSPFGTEYQITSGANHYKFSGKERDTESGLDYFGARYYSNGLGRFITPDWAAKATAVPYAEFADPQSLNLYTYVRNVPTSKVDADGHILQSATLTGAEIGTEVEPGVGTAVGTTLGGLIDLGLASYALSRLAPASITLPDEANIAVQTPALPATSVNTQTPASTPTTGVNTQTPASMPTTGVSSATASSSSQATGKPDFVVTPGGTAVPTDQDRMRDGFDKAGFPSKPASSPSGESGVIHTVRPRTVPWTSEPWKAVPNIHPEL